LDKEITDDTIQQLDMEEALVEQLWQLSLNAIAGTEAGDNVKLRALVQNQAMLIPVDSGSSHDFIDSRLVNKLGLSTTSTPPAQVKVANGEILITERMIPNLQLWCQGFTFHTDMRVLDLGAYDAIILGIDLLKQHSPMNYHWEEKTLLQMKGTTVYLQGVLPPPMEIHEFSGSAHRVVQKYFYIWSTIEFIEVVQLPASMKEFAEMKIYIGRWLRGCLVGSYHLPPYVRRCHSLWRANQPPHTVASFGSAKTVAA